MLTTREPLVLAFRLRRANYLKWAATSGSIVAIASNLDLVEFDDGAWTAKKDHDAGTPAVARVRSVVQLPDGCSAQPPVGVSVARGGVEFKSTYHVAGPADAGCRSGCSVATMPCVRWSGR